MYARWSATDVVQTTLVLASSTDVVVVVTLLHAITSVMLTLPFTFITVGCWGSPLADIPNLIQSLFCFGEFLLLYLRSHYFFPVSNVLLISFHLFSTSDTVFFY